MDFRRSGQLDERRRRVLMDEIASDSDGDVAEATSAAPNAAARGPVRAYAPAVLSERQPKVIDLLPVRPMLIALVLLVSLTGVAAIETIYVHLRTMPLGVGAAHLMGLDVEARGSIAAAYSALLLGGAAALSLVIFGIRAHRVDDYRGHYRIWMWTAAAVAWLSLDAVSGLHEALGWAVLLLSRSSPTSLGVGQAIILAWLGIFALLYGALGMRLLLEVWSSLPAFSALLLSMLLYVCRGLMELGMLPIEQPLLQSVLSSSLEMSAHWSVFAATVLFARHVYLDATGRLKVHIDLDRKKSKTKGRAKLKVVKSKEPTSAAKEAKPVAAPAANSTSGPARFGASVSGGGPSGAMISKASVTASAEMDEEDDDDGSGEHLSRSERRRLKKLARREQQRRAA